MRTRTKCLLLAPLALLIPLTLASSPAAVDRPDDFARTGSITAWSIAADGNVFLQIKDLSAPADRQAVWFVTPPNQTAATQFEEMVLLAVLHLNASTVRAGAGGPPAVVTVRGDVSNEVTGRTTADAIPLISLSQP